MNTNHWLRILLTLLAACLATVVLSTSTYAGEGHHGKGHTCPSYSDLDADGNGAVTAEEFYAFRAERMAAHAAEGHKMKNAAKAPAFEQLDLDGDDVLSAEEFAEHHASCPMMSKRDHEDRGKE